MKKTIIFLGVTIVLVICAVFIIRWNTTLHVADIIDLDTINKVEIWQGGDCVTLTEEQDIHNFTAVLESMKLKRKFPTERDGFVFSIDIYHENGDENDMTVLNFIRIDGKPYRCERDYCDDLQLLYDSFQTAQ
ncbi:MAG: hypothetical protein HFH14_09625 [Lachnospiraceae bacterium]|nr:hypothetical protein [Lachnospiraceae bacterium]